MWWMCVHGVQVCIIACLHVWGTHVYKCTQVYKRPEVNIQNHPLVHYLIQ